MSMAIASVLSSALVNPVHAQGVSKGVNPYPDVVSEQLWKGCLNKVQGLSLVVPLNWNSSTTVRAISDRKLKESAENASRERDQIVDRAASLEKDIEVQINERQEFIRKLLLDTVKFDQQIAKIRTALIAKNLSPDQRVELEKFLKELEDIRRDPNSLKAKMNEVRNDTLKQIRDQKAQELSRIDKEAATATQTYTSCACKIEALQKQYTIQGFYKQMLKELNGEPGISKDWARFDQVCSK
jgi:hypothetical protein